MGPVDRRNVLTGAVALMVAPMLATQAAAQDVVPSLAIRGSILNGMDATVARVATASPNIALTFDDGPHASLTPQLLDILLARGLRATFFVIGRNAARYPQILQRMVAEGHEIGNHTWSHPSLFGLSDAQVLTELDLTSQAVFDAAGRPPLMMRPPYGNLYDRQRVMIHRERGMPTVLWSVDPRDWTRPGSAAVASRILGGAHPGGIVLTHDIHAATVAAMPATLDGLTAAGYRCLPMSEMIGWPRWSTRRLRLTTPIG